MGELSPLDDLEVDKMLANLEQPASADSRISGVNVVVDSGVSAIVDRSRAMMESSDRMRAVTISADSSEIDPALIEHIMADFEEVQLAGVERRILPVDFKEQGYWGNRVFLFTIMMEEKYPEIFGDSEKFDRVQALILQKGGFPSDKIPTSKK